MAIAGSCPRCGAELPDDAPQGLCPKCMLAAALELGRTTSAGPQTAAASSGEPPVPNIPRYRILRLLGAGGMGAVYQAAQLQPHRAVALKVIKPGLASPEMLRRFSHEGE